MGSASRPIKRTFERLNKYEDIGLVFSVEINVDIDTHLMFEGIDESIPSRHQWLTFNGCPSVSPLLEAGALNIFATIYAGFDWSCPRPNFLEELFIFSKVLIAVSLCLFT
jgi:hypothetical protein